MCRTAIARPKLAPLAVWLCALLLASPSQARKGDLNGDGAVGVPDALIALRVAVGVVPVTAELLAAGDVSPLPQGDGRVALDCVMLIMRYALGLVPADQFPADTPTLAPSPTGVPRVLYQNPVAGFSVVVPDGWEMGSGTGGYSRMTIRGQAGTAAPASMDLLFFYSPGQPDAIAAALAMGLKAAGGGEPTVRATGRPNEFEVACGATSASPVVQRWLCAGSGGVGYVVGAVADRVFAQQFREDIDVALNSCQPIAARPVLRTFHEPTEAAYYLTLPYGWTWQGNIYRSYGIPSWFVWQAASNDGRTGCYVTSPWEFGVDTAYVSADQAAGGYVLQELRKRVPNAQLKSVRGLPLVDACETADLLALGFWKPRVTTAEADYVGSIGDVSVRVRARIISKLWGELIFMPGRGTWHLYASGVWAPEAQFDQLYPIGRGVVASLRDDPVYAKRLLETVAAVVGYRNAVTDAAAKAWDEYIRYGADLPPLTDPDTGQKIPADQMPPSGLGNVYKAPDGSYVRVPPRVDPPAGSKQVQ